MSDPAVVNMTPTTSSPRASLLGLPVELRHLIYQQVFLLPIDHQVSSSWKLTFDLEKRRSQLLPDLNPTRLSIPWLNLSLTSRTLASDLRSLMSSPSYAADERLHTYTLDLEGEGEGLTLGCRLGPTTWVSLPCPPQDVRILDVRYDTNTGLQTHGDGGPSRLTTALFQTLNLLIHCGPRLDFGRVLPEPMRIHELKIEMARKGGVRPARGEGGEVNPWEKRATDPEMMLYAFGSLVGMYVRTGVWKGVVDKVRMRGGGKTLSWDPEDVEGEGIPPEWKGYGFEWGLEAYQR
ncbi:unnamed protein product [Zymoseptoria tritici ST99CH_1E4]|uniref:Uncharacterized protein n=1 Tax=Zymoseptoria tritici ST99CH_1E4 TaxID=1276532 RepID=A0A2H1G510_ZYMTR|nr:unnamed protein product [Zymoseptoria tritici ST99CH_1E4]